MQGLVRTVSLTVTDNSGGTNTISHPITVSAAVTPGQYAADGFARTVVNGFGAADLGGPWSLSGKSSAFSVSSGVGKSPWRPRGPAMRLTSPVAQ